MKNALVAFLAMVAPAAALADYFQVFDGNTNVYIRYASIVIAGQSVGYTDAYGRIRIDRQPGTYRATLMHGRAKKQVTIVIDGSSTLKIIRAEANG